MPCNGDEEGEQEGNSVIVEALKEAMICVRIESR